MDNLITNRRMVEHYGSGTPDGYINSASVLEWAVERYRRHQPVMLVTVQGRVIVGRVIGLEEHAVVVDAWYGNSRTRVPLSRIAEIANVKSSAHEVIRAGLEALQRDRRDEIIRSAHEIGMPKMVISTLSGIARTTIDRVLDAE